MIKCPNCSAEMIFDPTIQKVKCEFCGKSYTKEELKVYESKINKAIEDKNHSYSGKQYRCNRCGAKLLTFDETAITFCSYCGSQEMLEDKMVAHNNLDFIIPFKKTKEECIKEYKKLIHRFLFIPSYFEDNVVTEKFRGIYMPYVIYNVRNSGLITDIGEEYSNRVGDYEYYTEYAIEALVNCSYDGISYDLVSNYYDNYSTKIPFDYKEAETFNYSYLIGHYADSFDVDKKIYKSLAEKIVVPDIQKRVSNHPTFRRYLCNSPVVNLNTESKIGMFPVYFLAIKNRKKDSIHYAVVNGQTGKVACDLPIDFTKYFFTSLLVSLMYFIILFLFVPLTPFIVSALSIIIAGIAFYIADYQSKKISIRSKHHNDFGVVYKENKERKIKSSKVLDDELYKGSLKEKNKKKKNITIMLDVLIVTTIIAIIACIFLFYNIMPENFEHDKYVAKSIFMIIKFLLTETVGGIAILCFILFMIGSKIWKHKNIIINNKIIKPLPKLNEKPNFKILYKEIIAMIIPIVALILNKVETEYYYIAIILSFLLILASFKDLIKEHNELSSNKLPQLEKRGGIKE